ncbi:MAG: flagellar biosynthesis protein FlaG [Thermoprotei archaeon]|nr:MAG: flagellar biosynthesis protein FlaG [Thermoprotei archaeon]
MNKKGVSPVIATLLLIIIAVAAAVLTYLWITGYLGTVQQQGGTESLQEKIRIEGVSYSGGTLYIYVRNIGDVRTVIGAVYVLDHTGTVRWSRTGLSTTINPGTQATFTVSVSLRDGETYVVKVVSQSGVEADYTFTYRV